MGCLVLQMRHLYVVIDCSRSMEDQDLKPNRLTSTLKVNSVADYYTGHQQRYGIISCKPLSPFSLPVQLTEAFVDEYFDQNPISQVCPYSTIISFTLSCMVTLSLILFRSCFNLSGSEKKVTSLYNGTGSALHYHVESTSHDRVPAPVFALATTEKWL